MSRWSSRQFAGLVALSAVVAVGTVIAATPAAAVVPGPPTAVTATAANGGLATVSFTAGPTDSAQTFTVAASPVGPTGTCGAASCAVSRVANGTLYTFTITATNAKGSTKSGQSNSVGWQAITNFAQPLDVGVSTPCFTVTAPAADGVNPVTFTSPTAVTPCSVNSTSGVVTSG